MIALQKLHAPTFVVGAPRSGTTLLQSLLSGSSEAYSLPETGFFCQLLPSLAKQADQPLSADDLAKALALLQEALEFDPPAEVRQLWCDRARHGGLTGADLFNGLLECYRPAHDVERKLRVIEKSPLHLAYIQEILGVYPDAQFVHIVRDPKDTISSWMGKPFAPTDWIAYLAQNWNLLMELAQRFDRQAPNAMLTIRYEDLVTQTERVLFHVCQFLQLEYSPAMLQNLGMEAEKNILDKEFWKGDVRLGQIRYQDRAWQGRISPEQAWFIEWETRRAREWYGYAPQIRLDRGSRLRTWWAIKTEGRGNQDSLAALMGLMHKSARLGLTSRTRSLAWTVLLNNPTYARHRLAWSLALFGKWSPWAPTGRQK